MAPKTPPPSDTADKFMLRMPDGMRDRIAGMAKANGRSMNSEIVARLEASFPSDGPISPEEAINLIGRLAKGTGLRITLDDPEDAN